MVETAVSLVKESCIECHVSFWITIEHEQTLRTRHLTFYCPNGHTQCYMKPREK